MFAPRLFMALMDRRNGVALGTTSTKNQIRWRPWIKGICKCLKLYSTGLLPKRKPVLLCCSRTICRMLAGNFRRTAGTWSLPVTLRLAPVSTIAMPVVVTVLAAIWVVLHSATSLMLETIGSLANVNGLGGSWDTTVEWGLTWFGDCWALSPYLVIRISIFLFAYLSIRLDRNFMAWCWTASRVLDGCSENAEKHTFDIHLASKSSSMITWGWSWGLSSSTCTTFACSRAASRLFGHSAFQCPNVRPARTVSGWCEPKVLLWLPCRLLCNHHGRNLCHETLTARNLLTFACHWSFVAPPGMTPVRFVSPECFTSSLQIHSQTAAQRGRLHRLPGQVSQGPLLSAHRLLHTIPDRSGTMWSGIILWRTLNVTGFHIVGCVHLLANITRSKQPFCWQSSHRFLNLGHWKKPSIMERILFLSSSDKHDCFNSMNACISWTVTLRPRSLNAAWRLRV